MLAHDPRFSLDLRLERDVLRGELSLGKPVSDHEQDPVGIDRFLDEVERAEPRRLDGRLDRAVSRNDDDGELRLGLVEAREHLHPVHPRHLDVEENEIDELVLRLAERLEAVLGENDAVPLVLEEPS